VFIGVPCILTLVMANGNFGLASNNCLFQYGSVALEQPVIMAPVAQAYAWSPPTAYAHVGIFDANSVLQQSWGGLFIDSQYVFMVSDDLFADSFDS
jgi:hypothetical protein